MRRVNPATAIRNAFQASVASGEPAAPAMTEGSASPARLKPPNVKR